MTAQPTLHRLEQLSPRAFEHPADRAATAALKSVPGLDAVVRKLIEFGYERAFRQVYLAASDHAPFGRLEALAVLKTNPDGAGIVQTIGPLKELIADAAASGARQRFVIVTDVKDRSNVVLRQGSASPSSAQS